jgi:O-antigen biosynthesis protein
MHQSSFNIMSQFHNLVRKHFQDRRIKVLDVGSYGVNGTYKEIFCDENRFSYTGLDLQSGPNVDYVPEDPYAWPELEDESFDVIISGQAFEHIEFPWLIMEEIAKKLNHNGLACIVAPSRGPEHKYPVDCWRYYPDGFRALAKWAGLEVLDIKTSWGASGFADGSDQWGDTFCILYKGTTTKTIARAGKRPSPLTVKGNTQNPLRSGKKASYYAFARNEVVDLIIQSSIPAKRILEIGCAGGATGKRVKELMPVDHYAGIEISEEAAVIARQHLDHVIVADVENTDLTAYGLERGSFDLLLALDVLEHLYDPWDTLSTLSEYLTPSGHVIASIPNIQNVAILQDLLKGIWRYEDAGILDATHLRFFTFDEISKLFSGAGLCITRTDCILHPSIDVESLHTTGNTFSLDKVNFVDLSKEEVTHLFTYQYLMIAKKDAVAGRGETALEQAMPILNAYPIGSSAPLPVRAGSRAQSSKLRKEYTQGLVSIVILTFNQLPYTQKCVKSIRKHTPESHEIIFVDNGSTDGTIKWLRKLVKENVNYMLIENSTNLGFAKGCNQGIQASSGEYIMLLNNDVIVTENWLSGMLECLNSAPDTGIIGPMTNTISGPQQVRDDTYRSIEYLDTYARKFRETYRHRRIPLRRIVGFCMLFRRDLIDRVGLLDESFGTGNFEDDDFCLRAALEGFRNLVAGDVFIHHYGSVSFAGNKIDYSSTMSGNRKILEEKWVLSAQSPLGNKLSVLKATELADDLYQKGKIEQAIGMLIDCIKITPDAKEIYFALARVFLESKRFDDAFEVVESMPQWAREELKGLECAGYSKEGLGLDGEADTYADRMLSLNHKYPAALNLKGVLAYKKEHKEAAEEYFKRALDSDPGYSEAHTNLGVLSWSAERRDEALEHLTRGFVLSPTVPDHSTLYYSALSSVGRIADAEGAFRDAKGLFPSNKNIAFLYIDALIQQGKHVPAMTEIEDAVVSFGLDDGILNAALSVREKIGPRILDKKGSKKTTLSLCMIVKNEEEHIAKCLRSVRQVVDEMIVVDTGSTDKTMDIARVFGAKVFEFPWIGDFSEARNYSLSKAEGGWILILDADEVLSPLDYQEMREIVKRHSSSPVAYTIVTRNYVNSVGMVGWMHNNGQYPEETGAGWIPSPKVRLFTRREDVFFSDPVHESLESSITKARIPIRPCNIVVHHYGKLAGERTQKKGEDYYLLGRTKLQNQPTNPKALQELALQAWVLGKHEEAVELWLKLIDLPECNPTAEAYMYLSFAYLALDRHEEALSASKKAMKLNPTLKEVVQVYATSEIIAGSVDKASAALDGLLMTMPGYPPALFLFAVVLCLQEQFEKMQELLTMLLQHGFKVTAALNDIGRQLHVQGKNNEAILILKVMIENRIGDQKTIELLEMVQKTMPIATTVEM